MDGRKDLLTILLAGLLGCTMAVAFIIGCGANAAEVEARSADAMARAENANQDMMFIGYQAAGDRCIDIAKDKAEAQGCLIQVKARWKSAWAAVEAFRLVHERWLADLDAGRQPGLSELIGAYCALQAATAGLAEMPKLPGVDCVPEAPLGPVDAGQEGAIR